MKRKLTILYGSQTGVAQDLAEQIWRESKRYYFTGMVQSMDSYDIKNLIHEKYVIFVCATTGQGEEPDNMKLFWKFLLRKGLPNDSLNGVEFGVLGLGDSSYTKFNFVAKKLHKRLFQLGGTNLLPLGLCDDQHDLGISAVSSPWLSNLWKVLEENFPVPYNLSQLPQPQRQYRWNVLISNESSQECCCKDIYELYSETIFDQPFVAEVKGNLRTTSQSHFQDVRLVTFNAPGIKWSPGDVFICRPRNQNDKVDALFDLFTEHNLPFYRSSVICINEIDDGPEASARMTGVSGGANTANSQDDEYRYAGCEDPKIMITTSRDPSTRLKMFVKELRLVFPNAQRMNRGHYEIKQLIHACRANDVTDFIIVHEHRGVPDNLVICHLPHGPTAYFNLSGVVMRHDIPDMGPMSEQKPHLIFHNFKTKLGERTMSILKYLFPVPKEESKRIMTFANNDDYISFRHHTYKNVERQIEIEEIGPRFQMKLYQIKLGTIDEIQAADTEWILRPFMNTSVKRRFLSDDDGWTQNDEIDQFN